MTTSIVTLSMFVPLIMALPSANVLRIQLPKYHDNDDLVFHLWQLTKICVTNGENIPGHKLQYFPNSLQGKVVNWFARFETTWPVARDEIQRAFIPRFSEVQSEGQAVAILHYAK